jgi:polyisoprenoid-binding protein YceI
MLTGTSVFSQIYMGKSCEITFFSSAPLENISGVNSTTKPIVNAANKDVLVKVSIQGFKFEQELMREHFNENYMESDKYPHAVFKGRINEDIDLKKDGVYKVTITGKLNVHNVEKERTLEATVVVKGGEISVTSKFLINLKEHGITVPELLFQKIAENVEVKISAVLTEGGK